MSFCEFGAWVDSDSSGVAFGFLPFSDGDLPPALRSTVQGLGWIQTRHPVSRPLVPNQCKATLAFFSDDRVVLLVLLKLNGNEKSHSRPEFSSMFPKVVTNVFCSSFLCQNLMFGFAH